MTTPAPTQTHHRRKKKGQPQPTGPPLQLTTRSPAHSLIQKHSQDSHQIITVTRHILINHPVDVSSDPTHATHHPKKKPPHKTITHKPNPPQETNTTKQKNTPPTSHPKPPPKPPGPPTQPDPLRPPATPLPTFHPNATHQPTTPADTIYPLPHLHHQTQASTQPPPATCPILSTRLPPFCIHTPAHRTHQRARSLRSHAPRLPSPCTLGVTQPHTQGPIC